MIQESLLECLKAKFGIEREELTPTSTWFSYGSNLSKLDFERKMKKNDSNLSLLCAVRSTLKGYERKLENRSKTRGLAYSINKTSFLTTLFRLWQRPFVYGIVHDVPIDDLAAFLHFEGVIDRNFSKVREKD